MPGQPSDAMSNLNVSSFMRFLLVGGTATALHYLIMFALLHWQMCDKLVASGVGFALSAVFNYLANAFFTFRSGHTHAESLPRFVATMSAGLAINTGVLASLTWLGLPTAVAQVLATGVVLVWNYTINAVWTFRKRQPS